MHRDFTLTQICSPGQTLQEPCISWQSAPATPVLPTSPKGENKEHSEKEQGLQGNRLGKLKPGKGVEGRFFYFFSLYLLKIHR